MTSAINAYSVDIKLPVSTGISQNAIVFATDPRGVSTGNADQVHASRVFESLRVGASAIASA